LTKIYRETMIPFFRKLRKQLANDNKPLKYLRYAMGEIVLVVIGILIALSINNWNEDRKYNVLELKLLEELKSSIIADLPLDTLNIVRNEDAINSSKLLLDYFKSTLPYNDSLDFHFAKALNRYLAFVKPDSYQNIKNYGLDFISNDTTKHELSLLFERNLNWLDMLDERISLYENNFMIPKIGSLFESVSIHTYSKDDKMKPLDYESLKHNEEFKSILKVMINYREQYLHFHKVVYARMKKLIEMIDHEIQLKKK